MKKNVNTLIKGLALSLIFGTISSTAVLANSYTVGPLLTIVDSQGSQTRATIDVSNTGEQPMRLRVYVEDFTYDRNKGFTSFSSHPFSAVPYLQFSPRELTVPPKTTRNVRVNILLPPNAPNGEYRAVVFAEELRNDPVPQTGGVAVVKTRIGSLFFVNKGSGRAEITAKNAVWDPSKQQVHIILENQGNASSNPRLEWKIERDGKEIDNGVIPGLIVQNKSERIAILNTSKIGKLPAGEYNISGQLQLRNRETLQPFSFKIKVTD
jgi:P pilus assembly chaperone PapD